MTSYGHQQQQLPAHHYRQQQQMMQQQQHQQHTIVSSVQLDLNRKLSSIDSFLSSIKLIQDYPELRHLWINDIHGLHVSVDSGPAYNPLYNTPILA